MAGVVEDRRGVALHPEITLLIVEGDATGLDLAEAIYHLIDRYHRVPGVPLKVHARQEVPDLGVGEA